MANDDEDLIMDDAPPVALNDDSDDDLEAPAAKPARLVPWVEKWRPRNLDAVSSQEEVTRTLSNAGELPTDAPPPHACQFN